MSTITPPQHEIVICPVCWEAISLDRWDVLGCCLTPSERAAIQ